MFIHAVLFEISPKQQHLYHRDCRLWAAYARKAKNFISYCTVKRTDHKNQFASVYVWRNLQAHKRFMNKFHDWLVSESKAKVKVLGYYNFKAIGQIK